jgi:antitoxin (DNA-binding transcriptional repressor) of toxin-antitoxin stability system
MQSRISAGKLELCCLELIDEVAATGQSIIITKRCKALARLVAVAMEDIQTAFEKSGGRFDAFLAEF